MNRSRQIVNQGLAALLVLMLVMPLSAFADSGKKSRRAKQRTAKTTAPATTAEKQDAQTPDKGETKSEATAKPSANDETAPPVTALKQTPQQQPPVTQPVSGTQTQDQTPIKRSDRQPPADRVGIDLNNVDNLSIHDAVVMALNKNLDIAVNRINVETSEYSLKAAQGVYDVNFVSQSDFISNTTPSANSVQATTGAVPLTTKNLDYNAGINQLMPTGGNYRVQWNNSRNTSNQTGNNFNPSFNNNITFNITQPVLRNFKIDTYRRSILIAKRNLDISDIQFKQTAINTINRVQDAYWDLVFALKNEQIARDAVDLAVVQLQNNQKRVEAGDLAPIEVISAQATVDQNIVTVIAALQAVTTAENVLKGLLSDNPNDDKFWSARIVPTTPVDYQPLNLTLTDATRLALTNRPELLQMREQFALNEISTAFAKDQLKPEIDLFGSYGTRGLAGTPASDDPLRLAQIDPRFIGGQWTALSNLFSNSFRSYSFGVTINFPFRNRVAKANLGIAKAQGRQLDLQQKQLVQNIQVDVRNALQAVESARQRIDAAKSGRVNAEAQLAGEEQKFKAGLSQNFLVLQRQNDLSNARGQELRANTDYNKAVADLQRVLAITLDSQNVQIDSGITKSDVAPKSADKKDQSKPKP